MSSRKQTAAMAELYAAAKVPASWPADRPGAARARGWFGAGQLITTTLPAPVASVTTTGPSAALEPRYISHFAPLDLYAPTLRAQPVQRWMPLSRSLPSGAVVGNEW